MKLLIIEDEDNYRQLLTEFLEDQNYEVKSADHPKKLTDECIENYDAFIIDVKLGDIRTAGIDYILENHQRLKQDALVIFVSNFGRENDIQERLVKVNQYRQFQWLDKPVDLVSLEQMLLAKVKR